MYNAIWFTVWRTYYVTGGDTIMIDPSKSWQNRIIDFQFGIDSVAMSTRFANHLRNLVAHIANIQPKAAQYFVKSKSSNIIEK